jgi:hypothetical protein
LSILTIASKAVDRLTPKNIIMIDTVNKDSLQLKQYGKTQSLETENKINIENAVGVLFAFIPTEVIALYVAVLGALNPDPLMKAQWFSFYVFLAITPIVVWLIYSAKFKKQFDKVPWNPKDWPLWEMTASTLAFIAWAFALPNSPFSTFEYWYSPAIAGVMILVTSTFLSLIAPFFNNEK